MNNNPGFEHEAQRQQLLLRVLLRDEPPAALEGLALDAGADWRGLQAHQAHAGALAQRALAAAYPALQQLLGDGSFAALARAHWRHAPPQQGDVAQWGGDLSAFLSAFEWQVADPLARPCLPDLARLEWAVHRATTAADHTPAPLGLHQLAQGDASLLHLWPQAGTALVPSRHPVVSLWQALQAPLSTKLKRYAAAQQAVARGSAEPALVWRSGWQVQVVALGAAEAVFTRRVLQGWALADALQAGDGLVGFDFQHWLLLQLRRGWLAGVGEGAGPVPAPQPGWGDEHLPLA